MTAVNGVFFDADGIIFERKISPGGIFEKTFENTPGRGLIFGRAYFRENPVVLLFPRLANTCYYVVVLCCGNVKRFVKECET